MIHGVRRNNDEREEILYNYVGQSFFRIRMQKTVRKDQQCFYCRSTIKTGYPSAYHSGLDQGKLYYYHVCSSCYTESITKRS